MPEYDSLFSGLFSGVLTMAVIHGLLLASILLFHNRFNSKSNKFLALSIIGICIILAYEFTFWLEVEHYLADWIYLLPIYIRSSIPIGIYFFVRFLIQSDKPLTRFENLGFVIIIIEICIESISIIVNQIDSNNIDELYFTYASWCISVIAAVLYLPKSLVQVANYEKYLYKHYSTTEDKNLRWLKNFLIALHILLFIWVINIILYYFEFIEFGDIIFLLITIGLIVVLFWLGYSLILRYNWFQIVKYEESSIKTKPNDLSTNTDAYFQELLELIEGEKLYENSDLTLDSLSKRLNISSGYLSQIINQKTNSTFFEFINTYRIKAIKEKLLSSEFENYTILGIALETGFRSKSTFNSVFKKFTGQTPSVFKKIHSK